MANATPSPSAAAALAANGCSEALVINSAFRYMAAIAATLIQCIVTWLVQRFLRAVAERVVK